MNGNVKNNNNNNNDNSNDNDDDDEDEFVLDEQRALKRAERFACQDLLLSFGEITLGLDFCECVC